MMEKKSLNGTIELKASADAPNSFVGYGAVFGNVDSHGDIIAQGAFTKSIAQHLTNGTLPLMLLNHDFKAIPIGKWNTLEEDAYGLKASGAFLDTSNGADAYVAARAGAITGLSIGYQVVDSEILPNGTRLIKEVNLLEISLVTFPSNDQARVLDVKSANDIAERLTKIEAEFKELLARFEDKAEEGEECDDDSDCNDDCSCNDDGECECDDEEKSETKYNQAAIEAVRNLSFKLKQENYGR